MDLTPTLSFLVDSGCSPNICEFLSELGERRGVTKPPGVAGLFIVMVVMLFGCVETV